MKLELIHITKAYKDNEPIIKDFSYSFESGKIYVIKGVSGCGKSTLLNLIGGLDTSYEGTVKTDGVESTSKMSGYIFQNSLLVSGITLLENLLLIKNSKEEVYRLCEKLKINDLLSKYPEQLSGGERQRASIVRALLNSPRLLIADEPTASLDDTNSKSIAKVMAELRDKDRIIIIATHEHYFDEYADVILNLHYGVIEKEEQNTPKIADFIENERQSGSQSQDGKGTRSKGIGGFRFALKRRPRLLISGGILLMALVFFVIYAISALKVNFSSEYFRYMRGEYPLDVFGLYTQEFERFKYKDDVKVYEYYTAYENGYTAVYLLDKKNSVFSIKGMIKYGKFPSSEYEILVNPPFVMSYFGADAEYREVVGKSVTFKDTEFVISGIVNNFDSKNFESNLYGDDGFYFYNFHRAENTMALFVPYDTLVKVGEKATLPEEYKNPRGEPLLCVYEGLYENTAVRQAIALVTNSQYDAPNGFYQRVENSRQTVDTVIVVFYFILFVTFAISCIFMSTIVQTELFYRRREIGYLQIFGLGKKRIKKLLVCEYFLKVASALVMSLVFYIEAASIYALVLGAFPLFDPLIALVFCALLAALYLLTVYLCIKRFLKKNVITLIT